MRAPRAPRSGGSVPGGLGSDFRRSCATERAIRSLGEPRSAASAQGDSITAGPEAEGSSCRTACSTCSTSLRRSR
eukprot:15461205-Alexandrium_andersonii.AAC.1